MHRTLVLALLTACAPTIAEIDEDTAAPDPDPGPGPACANTPTGVPGLTEIPVTVFYQGQLQPRDPVDDDEVTVHTAIQREWSTVRSAWAPEGVSFGNLDDDPEGAGHGVLLGAWRSSTCGMTVAGIEAWRLPDEAGTAYVELTVEDSSGGCDTACDMEQWTGAALALPLLDFPFSRPVQMCVVVEDACE